MQYSGWNQGSCYPGMGMHYWRHTGLTSDSACEDAGPIFLMYDRGVLAGFGIVLISMGRAPTVGGVLPSQLPSGPFLAGNELFEFPRSVAPFFAPGADPTCFGNIMEWDRTTAGAANLNIGASMHFSLSDTSVITCEPPPSPGIACATDEECPVGLVCSSASRAARMLLFGATPTRGQCVPL